MSDIPPIVPDAAETQAQAYKSAIGDPLATRRIGIGAMIRIALRHPTG
jgi:hypothetical protein